ncbi:MAG: hypothetical protein KC729_03260 [Candidatus Eisenbacteria bacterium]|uniref:Porin n=1 Tax=Eiseniibacteriota bacterium TaxID=2212470 RepID=A0A956RPG4_UNCEI|nr:hypothetical protein [Candidatus Eisenbacteria bacterium]
MRRFSSLLGGLALVGWMATASMAGAKLEIKDGASIDLGFRVQHWTLLTQADTDGDGKWDTTVNHRIRRGRLRLNGVVNEQVSAFLQTDVTGIAGTGYDARVIDAYVLFKANPWFQLYFGENMVPANRQNITSSGALLAIDRPGTTYKSLTWGGRSTYAFTNNTFGPSDSGLRGSVDVRDLGITVFGAGPINEKASFKYYAGTYNGVQAGLGSDNERFTARGQINFFDNESGYYNSACYLGKKKTVGIGASVDLQSEVGAVTKGTETDPQQVGFDYTYFSVDGFAEYPLGEHTLTVEVGAGVLDLGGKKKSAEGTGIYAQGGLLVQKVWQPWLMYEMFSSDADGNVGNFNTIRAGLTRYLSGQNANIKVGVEIFNSDTPLTVDAEGKTIEDSVVSAILALYTTY